MKHQKTESSASMVRDYLSEVIFSIMKNMLISKSIYNVVKIRKMNNSVKVIKN